jgi:hypothetical protein
LPAPLEVEAAVAAAVETHHASDRLPCGRWRPASKNPNQKTNFFENSSNLAVLQYGKRLLLLLLFARQKTHLLLLWRV